MRVSDPATRVTAARDALATGDAPGALSHLQRAVHCDPSNAALHHDVGYLCLRLGRVAEAADAFRAALATEPGFALASLRLGVALQALGEAGCALDAYARAASLDPLRPEPHYRAGSLLEVLGRRAEAIAAFGRASSMKPKDAVAALAEARVFLADGCDEAAEKTLRRLLACHPGHLEATDLLATVLADAGRLEDARTCYEHVTAASPAYAGSFYDLVRCRRIGPGDATLCARMSEAAANPALHAEARLKLHLALGKAADDLGDPGEAMRHFGLADAIRNGLGGGHDQVAAHAERLIARDRSFAGAGGGGTDKTPVLIIGLPRSGTTLVEQILACHPQIHPGGELPFWTERGALWERSIEDLAFREQAAADYLGLLRGLAPSSPRVTDKMPLNLYWAGLIHRCLPGATIILCRRRPIDVALSIHRTYFNQHLAFPTGGEALVTAVRAAERLADHWRSELPDDCLHEIPYERLVGAPERTIRDLLSACGLSWHEACLRPERNPRIVRTPSKWQVRQPITAQPADAWRRYERWLGPLAELT